MARYWRTSTTSPLHQASRRLQEAMAAQDEATAAGSTARLLITASTHDAVETIARRVHGAGLRATGPFVSVDAISFPLEPRLLQSACAALLDSASGGTLLLADVQRLPVTVQRQLIELLAQIQDDRPSAELVRLMFGTTVCLYARVMEGRFSERLFYRLNVLQLRSASPSFHAESIH